MEKSLKSESDAYRETNLLKKELEKLLAGEELGYADIARIDEINERLQELEPLPDEFSAEEEWGKFEKEFLCGRKAVSETKRKSDDIGKRFRISRFKLLGAAAVIAVIGVFLVMPAGADLFSGFRFLKDDSVEIRYDEYEPSETDSNDFISFGSIEELQAYLDVKLMFPEYMPEGYDSCYAIYSPESNSAVIRYYTDKEDIDEIVLIIRKVTEGKTITMPKDEASPYTVVHNNIEFNVYGNDGESFVEWLYNGYSYYLGGALSQDEINKIIEHIK